MVGLARFSGIGAVLIEQLFSPQHMPAQITGTSPATIPSPSSLQKIVPNSYRTLTTNVQTINSVFAQALYDLVPALFFSLFPAFNPFYFVYFNCSFAPQGIGKKY